MYLSLAMRSDCAQNIFPDIMLDRPAQQAIQIFQIARFSGLLVASILLSKSGMSTFDIGTYESMLLITGTLSFFWINGTTQTFLSRYKKSANPENETQALFGSIASLTLIIALGMLVFSSVWTKAYTLDIEFHTICLFIVYFVSNCFSFLADYVLLAQGKGKGLMQLSIFQFTFQIIAIAVPAFLYQDLFSVIVGANVFMGIKALVSLYLVSGNSGLKFNYKQVHVFLQYASPLIISFLLGGASIYLDGLIINRYFDKSEFAVYQYGAREFPISLLLANAFSAAMVLHIGGHQQDYQKVLEGTQKLIKRLFPIVILLMMISYWAYPLVYTDQFKQSFLFFNIYLLLIISRLVFPHSILLGLGHSRLILHAAIAEFIINIAASMYLLQIIGISGVAYGTVIAHISNKVILMVQLHKQGVSPRQYIPITLLSLYSILLVAVFIIFTYLIHA